MLVLTRQQNEQIELTLPDGAAIVITAVRIGRHSCRIGVDAPRNVNIARRELVTASTEPVTAAGGAK